MGGSCARVMLRPLTAAAFVGGTDEGHRLCAAEGRGEKYRPGSVATALSVIQRNRTDILSLKNNVQSFIED